MSLISFNGVGISGMAAAVPKKIIDNYSYTDHFSKEEVEEVVSKIGIYQRRFTDANTTSSDLCFAAAERLIEEMKVSKDDIDMLVFVSQTPDYRMPATSIILQDRLGLSKTTLAFDLVLGCSAFVYALSVVYSFMEKNQLKKALLLNGETRSKVYSPKDRKTAFIFGDGGIAALIENNKNFGKSFFSLNSDGSRESLIKIKSGGYRFPSSEDSVREKVVDDHGNIRSDEHGYMNGADVFNFVLREIPKDIKKIFEYSGISKEEINYFIFHQANSYMNSYLTKKLKITTDKVPVTIDKFGNTSSVSIPLTLVSELKNKLNNEDHLLLCGFGVGMSWATAILKSGNIHISDLVEV